MTYLRDDARLIRSHLPTYACPPEDADALFLLYAVLMRVKGVQVTETDVHDAWAAWMETRNPRHPALVPFELLDEPTQRADMPYVQAIRSAARARGTHRAP
ncbi:hypothetical protein NGF19_08665 [Streptomyces sp. RY43-2]|uniref:DUF7701 domain-containing protein n=1 Tax=Streptomyces macrolidinus TaxID=2952607 RepID=A0ABT0ZAR7_9ACTN|nr:hypothetical protein [Streptomyces macrolidinus]MCN9240864.1 hypothetical protein [Streptomyces macrolidinus]